MTKWLLLGAAALSIGACRQAPETLDREDFTEKQWEDVQKSGAAMLFWSAEEKRDRFTRMEDFFNGEEIAPSDNPRPLPEGSPIETSDADQVMLDADLAGLMVLQDGKIAYEGYRHGFSADKRWTSFSTAKLFVGVLAGAAIKDGDLKLGQPITDFVPELRDVEAYDGVTVEHLLTMSSGVNWNEEYSDPENDNILLYTRSTAGELADSDIDPTLDFLRTRVRADEPGAAFDYKSGDSALLGIVVERAVGQSLAIYAKEKIVDPAGFAAPMFWMKDAGGHSIGPCCLSLAMADYARFAQWMMEGLPDGKGGSIWTDAYRDAATSIRMPTSEGRGYGYHMNIAPNSRFHQGLFGQGVIYSPKQNVVMIHLSAWETPNVSATNSPRISDWYGKVLGLD